MAEGSLNPAYCPSFSEGINLEKPVVSREPKADVVVQPYTSCAQCKKKVKSPYLLCCLHSACEECLPGMAVEGRQRIKCGECGDTSTHCSSTKGVENRCESDIVYCVPIMNSPLYRYMEGIKVVEKAIQNRPIPCEFGKCKSNHSSSVLFCIDCWNFMCQGCSESHEMFCSYHSILTLAHLADNRKESCALLAKGNPKPKYSCTQHQEEILYFCKTCCQRFCQVCITVGNCKAISKHSLACIYSETDSCGGKSSLLCALVVLRHIAEDLQAKCDFVQEELHEKIATIEKHKVTALQEIHATFNVMQEALDVKRNELCKQIVTTAEDTKRAISSQLEWLIKTKQCCIAVHPPASLLQTSGTTYDLLASKDMVLAHQSLLTSKCHEVESKNTVSPVLSFGAANQDAVLRAIGEVGIVIEGACPVKCTVEPKPEQLVMSGSDPVSLNVFALDSKGIGCTKGGDKIEAFLYPNSRTLIASPAVKARVSDNDTGTYCVSFHSVYPGPCLLSIGVNRKDIRGSPFQVSLYRDTHYLKDPKGHLEFVRQPGNLWGVGVSSKGMIFVADYSGHKIHVFNNEKMYITSFSTHGSGAGQLKYPCGLTVGSNGLVYVANYGNSRIEVFREDGTFVRKIGSGHLNYPWNVTTHNQKLYIADTHNHRVLVYTLQGDLVHSFGKQGKGPGQFVLPSAVAFSPHGDIYTADHKNHCVQIFDTNGRYKGGFGRGQLKDPLDIVVTCNGDVLVADFGKDRIAVFSTHGGHSNLILSHSFKVQHPRGLTIDNDGCILVTEWSNMQVAFF